MSAAATAHGLDGTLVKPDWAPLRLDEVRALLRSFDGCGEPIEILTVSPRPLSAASVVSTSRRRVFVKRHHRTIRDREGLLEEHRFLRHLKECCAPVLSVLQNRLGETAIEIGEWCYEVHQAAAGVDLYGEAVSWTPFRSAAHARSAGEALARLHRAAEGFNAPQRQMRRLVASFTIFANEDPAAEMEHYLASWPSLNSSKKTHGDCAEALALLAPFHAELLPMLPALKPLWTQNDLHASNLLWSDASENAKAVAVIDFGLADRTNAVHDLAQAIERNIADWIALMEHPEHPEKVTVHLDALEAMLNGYESVRKLSTEEAAALAPMTALCHAEYALSEAEYFLSVLGSREKGRVATKDYLVGHARWFHSSNGARLLDWLRAWAQRGARR